MIYKTNKSGLANYFKSHPHQEGIIVSKEKKFIYMKPTKTAGTSILRYFLEKQVSDIIHKKDHPKLFDNWINSITDEELEEYFIFSVVRNPYDRFVSASTYLKIEFKDLLNNYQKKTQDDNIRVHTMPLYYYTHIDGELFTDFICRFETLQADMNLVCDNLNIERQQLPLTNVSNRKKFQDYYDEKSKQLVYDLYTNDFLYFGYSFSENKRISFTKRLINKLKRHF